MQALMLAAGMGKRLGKYTEDNTKCMVDIAGKKLLLRTIEALKIANINKFIIVTGYKAENLKKYILDNVKDMEVIFVDNEDYASTNNIYSLYLAKEFLEQDDTILLESDLVFDENLVKDIVNCKHRDLATVAKYEPWMDGTVTLVDNDDNIIEFIEKKDFSFSSVDNYYKTVNIYKFSREFSKNHYIPFLEAYIKAYGKDEYYELVLKAIAHLSRSGLKAFKLTNQKWYEIDDAQDLDIANTLFAKEHEALLSYQRRYGGYWRFPNLEDFCYLVNPYFPPQTMLNQIKYSFEDLICQYPSGLNVQNIGASIMFGVDEDEIIVGNGAAELINSLKNVIHGKLAITIPTFNEYIRCFNHCKLVEINTFINDYQLKKEDFLNIIDEVDSLIIINPDNPSGSYLDYESILEIINKCHKQNKRVIFDESFIDFVEPNLRYTLINSDILNSYPNLIVIKSISKSYGIPGLRLGVMACGDKDLLTQVRMDMPVWNVNSLAEYFLQIISLYQKDYTNACDKLASQRQEFANKLGNFEFLEVYNSQANYLMCRVNPPYTATQITEYLLKTKRILIKDLSSKEGFSEGEYIRIAVKSETQNSLVIDALNEIRGDLKNENY